MKYHLPFLGTPTNQIVLEAMGYRDGTNVCRNCKFFVPTNQGGSHDALGAHCTRNAFALEVKPEGTCNHFCDRQSEPLR